MEIIRTLTIQDTKDVAQSILARREIFPDEPFEQTVGVILFNFGDRITFVSCINGEWRGQKKDLQPTGTIPKCPNGHVLMQGYTPVLVLATEG